MSRSTTYERCNSCERLTNIDSLFEDGYCGECHYKKNLSKKRKRRKVIFMVKDMKEFWDKQEMDCVDLNPSLLRTIKKARENQGFFFWERGGKNFYLFDKEYNSEAYTFEVIIRSAKVFAYKSDWNERTRWACDFLDALDCLGEKEIEKKVNKLGGV